ncbi:putative translation factor (plasmid) [Legionella adelaidensis]|uniref:Threonylcarbamoyl-AMP synthase n=1 Tax=Legionella adelaidensis TaxID=45056 RepID=A0A0W0R624_9GAMM|nr:L-threonylcarbamoyladenylate synthase [Legionella adelaidensis]KTC66478.1 SUA5/yciO/yrdC family transporter:Sua5/YciO/YrdC/YwlC family transporter protein [Legionella adelaidensis]VEH86234.1 putative translation factor [Legionella adelaidensis]
MKIIHSLLQAREEVMKGSIIAYPTEAVYGLGCDPFNMDAVNTLLALKSRPIEKGFIVLISNWEQLYSLTEPLSEEQLKPVRQSWPGPVTWIFPKAETLPQWLSGSWNSIAIRMSAHPIARGLALDNPIISTSANITGFEPARDKESLFKQFPQGIDFLVNGDLGGAQNPSAIYDVLTGKRLR